jgi:deazaflavin-dependent oxidoreductase (nitroreductase family)
MRDVELVHGYMKQFPQHILESIRNEREVSLTTYGRKTGKPSTVTIWVVTDGNKVYIRSGQGMRRHWPKNLQARPEGLMQLDRKVVRFRSRHITDASEARHSSKLYGPKYGPSSPVKPSNVGDPLTLGEQAVFELLPADA